MADTPKSVLVRSYQVGFGDCFLLKFRYASGDVRNVLIDFGTTGVTKLKTTPSKHMPLIAEQIAAECGRQTRTTKVVKGKKKVTVQEIVKEGKLHAVIATHRHRDHISGFATDGSNGGSGNTIAALKPNVVIQPWTEDPQAAKNAKSATAKFQKGLTAMHDLASAAVAFAGSKAAAATMSARTLGKLAFVGEDNVKNLSAVRNLIAMSRRTGAKPAYVSYGSKSGLERVLPGVKVTVLGPPTLKQTQGIATMRSRDKNEFWQLLAGPPSARSTLPLATGLRAGSSPRGKSAGNGASLPPQARWFARRLAALRGSQILSIVTSLDAQMNNTSVILLFEFGGRKLLFPGDAQLENWRYALAEAGDGAEAKRNAKRLSDIDLYKVGHHGSLNATPKKLLWERLTRRKDPVLKNRLKTLMSTMPGKHPGKPGGIGEVPRKPLVEALKVETVLRRTDTLKKADPLYVEHQVDAR